MQYDVIIPCFPLVDVIVDIKGELPICVGDSKIINAIWDEAGGPANSFFVARRLGMKVLPIGIVGDDARGKFILKEYEKEYIDTSALRIMPGHKTPQALCINDRRGEHAFITTVHEKVVADLSTLKAFADGARSMVLTGYLLASEQTRDTLHQLALYMKETGKKLFFDPGPLINMIPSQILTDVLSCTTTLLVNDDEARVLTQCDAVEVGAERLSKTVSDVVVVKAGRRGCYIYSDSVKGWFEGLDVPLVDTTGAGDSFLGAFVHGTLVGWKLEEVALVANMAGAIKTSKLGSGRQVPTLEELVHMLETHGYAVSADVLERRKLASFRRKD